MKLSSDKTFPKAHRVGHCAVEIWRARSVVAVWLALTVSSVGAVEFHVAVSGNNTNAGTRRAPLRTIQRAADLAQPGDVITVHAGVYRERINPPRGGVSDQRRIVYQAARGAAVEIKGSEIVKGWVPVEGDVWRVTLPNTFFGDFNPYTNVIGGDWFADRGRKHHTGAVYLNGEWLIEAAQLDEVLAGADRKPDAAGAPEYLLNVAWLRPVRPAGKSPRIPATSYAAQHGIQTAPCTEGGDCIGWIEHGDWVRYENLDFGPDTRQVEIRVASATAGGRIELRRDHPEGELEGSVPVTHTGGWQTWVTVRARTRPLNGVRTLCLVFKRPPGLAWRAGALDTQSWFAQVDATNTTIWAQFGGADPNAACVEINARQTVFYPDQPGRNFITVRGFALRHAATPWAPPTAEQIGLIGTHWSRGWIIEDNHISHSVCSGIALGKHGDAYDNTSANTAEGYVQTIARAHAHPLPWTRENIGHHVVRRNTIQHCEQAGIVGSLGPAFSLIEDNVIRDIHVRRRFSGAEMAGIKFHGAIDTVIRRNHIARTCRGLWLDWMAQGTRVSQNLFHENASEDLFVEVNHGPFVVDNNVFLSPVSVLDMSESGAYAHNLFGGKIINRPEPQRGTPYHPPHATVIAGLALIHGGDNRFYNNLFVGDGEVPAPAQKSNLRDLRWIPSYGLWGYDGRLWPIHAGGNVYWRGAEPSVTEKDPLVRTAFDPGLQWIEQGPRIYLRLVADPAWRRAKTAPVTTARLGHAKRPNLPYVNADDSPLRIDRDYFGRRRSTQNPTPGPFEKPGRGERQLRLW